MRFPLLLHVVRQRVRCVARRRLDDCRAEIGMRGEHGVAVVLYPEAIGDCSESCSGSTAWRRNELFEFIIGNERQDILFDAAVRPPMKKRTEPSLHPFPTIILYAFGI